MRVNEIFYSLQGEGTYSGSAAIFIRLSGCNLSCPFCDTDHKSFVNMEKEEILHKIASYPSKHIVFTGGEPCLQLNEMILSFFKDQGYFIQVETNGTKFMPTSCIDWVTCSPKTDFCKNAEIYQKHIDEVKVVFDGHTDPEKFLSIKAKAYFLQPCDVGDIEENKKIIKQCVGYILDHPQWKLSLQTQKILDIK